MDLAFAYLDTWVAKMEQAQQPVFDEPEQIDSNETFPVLDDEFDQSY